MHYPLATDPAHTWRAGIKTACRAPGIALLSSFVALGALMGEAGFSLAQAVLFSLFGFALPAQLAAAELHAHGAGLVAITITAFLVNARLLLMTISLLPLLVASSDEKPKRWRDMLLAHFVAVTSWVCFLTTYHEVAPQQRRRYYAVLGATLFGFAAIATVAGYYLGGELPRKWLVALLFLNPVYFLCLMVASLTKKSSIAAFVGGAAVLPLLHQISPEWDILICGVVAGLVSFYFVEQRRQQ